MLIEKEKGRLTGYLTRKSGVGLVNVLLKVHRLIYARAPTKSDVKIIKSYCRKLYLMRRDSGMGHVIKYLKTSSIMLCQYVARNEKRFSSREIGGIGVAASSGLPRIIPAIPRKLIRRRKKRVITLWLSYFNLYRYLESDHKVPSLATVTDKGESDFFKDEGVTIDLDFYLKVFRARIYKLFSVSPLKQGDPYLSSKAGSTSQMTQGLPSGSYVS